MFNNFWKNLKRFNPLPHPMTINTMTPTTKLSELRKLMEKNNLSAYYIPSEDSHQVK